jgi:hypothetical protein
VDATGDGFHFRQFGHRSILNGGLKRPNYWGASSSPPET